MRILFAPLAFLVLTATAFGGWGFAVGSDTLGEQARRTPSVEPPIPRKTPTLSSEPHVAPTAPTPVSQSSSCEKPDTSGALYAPFLPIDDYLRLTAKNTTSLGTYVPSDVEELGSAYSIRSGESGSLRKAAAAAVRRMVRAAAADGVTIRLVSGYRSCETQRVLFNAYVAQYGLEQASRFSARPGQSEHQLGLAADISGPTLGYSLSQSFGGTKEGTWLKWNAWTFGFVLSHPAGGERITGYMYEPWHWRFVGGWKQARKFDKSGLTLYEWLLTQGN